VLSLHFSGRTEKNDKNISAVIVRCSGRYSNRTFPETESEASQLGQTVQALQEKGVPEIEAVK
jgi:hypothetical protein